MDTLSKLRKIFNNPNSYDTILRIDGKYFYIHKCILQHQSEFFMDFFNNINGDDYAIKMDFSCSKKRVIVNWYDYKGNGYEEESNNKGLELYYNHEVFVKFLAFFYGFSIQTTTDQLFSIAYLAKKYKVPSLTKFTDDLLKLIPTLWEKGETKWKVTLMVSKWLGLNETRIAVLKHLCKIENFENFKEYKKELDKEDFREFQKMLNKIREINNNKKENREIIESESEDEDENKSSESSESSSESSSSEESSSENNDVNDDNIKSLHHLHHLLKRYKK